MVERKMKTTIEGYELKECPFCGGSGIYGLAFGKSTWATSEGYFQVECLNIDCGCAGPTGFDFSGAAEKWNKRNG